MGLLDVVLGHRSMQEVRVSNFRACAAASSGTTLVDEANGHLTVRVHSETAVSDDLTRLLNASHVSITELRTEAGDAYLTVAVT
ncbi:hypothetical protein [Halobacterium sp. KA-6]|uniref:hypothetical protein n=1 Tax=Halobacterium sp. KA-6 TaxID=2896368 RepID=UPI001E485AF1|nr:hypothetical protein [Halobacterium sp. KA-6]MCD2201842.1 hypothetical protein [Halobacterium sp. KA-6]